MKKIVSVIVFIGFISGSLLAQMHKTAVANMPLNKDSLLAVIDKPQDDSGKVNAYHMLGAITAGTDAVAAIGYSKKGIALSKRLNQY